MATGLYVWKVSIPQNTIKTLLPLAAMKSVSLVSIPQNTIKTPLVVYPGRNLKVSIPQNTIKTFSIVRTKGFKYCFNSTKYD